MRRIRAFTLIEVLVVVSILALLISIMMPSLREVRRISKRTVCTKNLEQIGVGMQAYLLNTTPRDTFPYACRLPSWERQQAKDTYRKPLPSVPEVLKNELKMNKAIRDKTMAQFRTNEVFACPADQNTMSKPGDVENPDEAIPTDRYFDHEGTSYEWEQNLNGTKLDFKLIRIYANIATDKANERNNVQGITRKFEIGKVPRNNMWMMYDFEPFHGGPNMLGSHNVLYTDLHVQSDKWDKSKRVGENNKASAGS